MQMMTMCGDADGMVSGARHTTAATIRPGLQVLRTKDSPLVSSVFFMCLPDKVQAFQDVHNAGQSWIWMSPSIDHSCIPISGPEASS